MNKHQKEFISLVEKNASSRGRHTVFKDFCEMSAIAFSNKFDILNYDKREKKYLEIAGNYQKDEMLRFSEMLACVVKSLEISIHDCLGEIYMELAIGNPSTGQYFTPWSIAQMMSALTDDNSKKIIDEKGFFSVIDPACGSGVLLMAKADDLLRKEINYQQCMHATGIDIDSTAVHMAYIHFSLLHIPGIIYHGNSLGDDFWDTWKTPAHCLGFWDSKLNKKYSSNTGNATFKTVVKEKATTQDVDNNGQLFLF